MSISGAVLETQPAVQNRALFEAGLSLFNETNLPYGEWESVLDPRVVRGWLAATPLSDMLVPEGASVTPCEMVCNDYSLPPAVYQPSLALSRTEYMAWLKGHPNPLEGEVGVLAIRLWRERYQGKEVGEELWMIFNGPGEPPTVQSMVAVESARPEEEMPFVYNRLDRPADPADVKAFLEVFGMVAGRNLTSMRLGALAAPRQSQRP